MKRFLSLMWISILVAMMVFSACSNEQATAPEENEGENAEISLDKEFGGYSTNDEAPAFGSSDMMEEFSEDQVAADTYSSDPSLMNDLNSDKIKAYFLRVTWGYLEGNSTETEATDWSGSIEINKGTLLVLKTIRFEDNDFLHLPRDSRKKVEFTSFTKPHFDGLALAILDNDSTDDDVEGSLTINAGAYSATVSYSDLDSLELIEDVGSKGQQVSIVSRSKEVTPFAGGFFAGHWIKDRPHGGKFRGRWINSLGTNAGYLRGIWGINQFGNKVFKGKYISLNGEFRGLLAGQWAYRGDENRGFFKGRWVNREHTTVGTLHGHFKTGRQGDGRGFFQGRYRVVNSDNNN
ncbi:MAG: hypothetical protein ACE5HS_14115 [bacterium]